MSNTFTLKQLHKMAKELEKKYLSASARAEMFNVNVELSIHGLEFLEKTDAPSVNDIAIVIRQLQSNKSTLANSSSYVSDRIGISALTPAARDSVKEQLKTLRKQRDGLNDELTAMNITITQELKADDIAKLTRLGIL